MAVAAEVRSKWKYIAKYQFKTSAEFRTAAGMPEVQNYVRKYFAK